MTEGKPDKRTSRILIVDDVEANRFILRDIIFDMGCQPVLAETGMQAIKMLQYMKPQLIILDIAMPDMDGYEVCNRIKERPDTKDIPIIFISAFDEPEDIVKGFSLGVSDYITKPFIPQVVKARVGMHLKLYEANVSMQYGDEIVGGHLLDSALQRIYPLFEAAQQDAAETLIGTDTEIIAAQSGEQTLQSVLAEGDADALPTAGDGAWPTD